MKLFVLEYVDGCPDYDMTDSAAVLAPDEACARALVERGSRGDNPPGDWLNEKITVCTEVDMSTFGIVLTSFRAG